MPADPQRDRREAHDFLDRLPDSQLPVVHGLLASIVESGSAELDDEPVTAEDRARLPADQGGEQTASMEEVLGDFDLSLEDLSAR